MSTTMTLDILTPERSVCCVEAEIVIARALDGELGILPNHAPLVVALDIAPLRYRKDGMEHFVAISNGFMEVKDNRVIILAPTAETEAEIDFSRAESGRNGQSGGSPSTLPIPMSAGLNWPCAGP